MLRLFSPLTTWGRPFICLTPKENYSREDSIKIKGNDIVCEYLNWIQLTEEGCYENIDEPLGSWKADISWADLTASQGLLHWINSLTRAGGVPTLYWGLISPRYGTDMAVMLIIFASHSPIIRDDGKAFSCIWFEFWRASEYPALGPCGLFL
jgi:hypothetical protein